MHEHHLIAVKKSSSSPVCPVPDVFSEGFYVLGFAFTQAWWYRGAQNLENPLESMNQPRNVTRSGGAAIKCLRSEPRICSQTFIFLFLFIFFFIRITFVVSLAHQNLLLVQFCSECSTFGSEGMAPKRISPIPCPPSPRQT